MLLRLKGCPRPHCYGDLEWDTEDKGWKCLLCERTFSPSELFRQQQEPARAICPESMPHVEPRRIARGFW